MHSFKKYLNAKTLTPEQLAKKHGVSIDQINAALKKGIATEHEHTKNAGVAKEIALDHIGEDPKYYDKLDKAKL